MLDNPFQLIVTMFLDAHGFQIMPEQFERVPDAKVVVRKLCQEES